MRLEQNQIIILHEIVTSVVGEGVAVRIFGSRLNDDLKGGDLDLLLEAGEKITLLQKARIKTLAEQKLTMPVDIVTLIRGDACTPFQQIAKEHSQAV